MPLQFDTDVQFVKGVGPKLGDVLRRRGIDRVRDLLEYYPRTYEDRRAIRHIQSLVPDQLVSITAKILKVRSIPMGKSKRRIWEVLVGDATGRIACKYFRVPYRGYFERFQPMQEVRVVGRVTVYRGAKEFHHPDIHPLTQDDENENALIPIYTEIEGMTSAKIARLIRAVVSEPVPEILPAWIREKHGLMPLEKALREVHNPPVDQGDLFLNFQAAAQRRLIFDEFFLVELRLAQKRAGIEKEKSPPIVSKGEWAKRLRTSLEFELTGAQSRAYQEIVEDLSKPH
ncbi:MAG TPA: OB-fold nucleic acid binding domain-containing protein, partial [Bdellovibrionales bacterium]|nr:OB-fold nucleic acid binding domain-containing protein [Bdellovibrionales bacterium]